MSVKTTGAEYKKYIQSDDPIFWPDGSWMDDESLTIDGKSTDSMDDFDNSKIADNAVVVIECGAYYSAAYDDDPIELTTHFKRWRKAQTTVRILVEVHKDKLESLKGVIKANSGKVL